MIVIPQDQILQILLPAHCIPLGSIVTKRTGKKEYKLLETLRVFGEDGEPREIKALPGARFLVCDGTANAIGAETELMWRVSAGYLSDFIRHGDRK